MAKAKEIRSKHTKDRDEGTHIVKKLPLVVRKKIFKFAEDINSF